MADADGAGESLAAGDRPVVMAVIGAPHGVRGAVRLTVFAGDPLALRRYNPFLASDGRRLKLGALKPVGKAVVAEVEGVADRTAAEALRGLTLSVPRRRLPRPGADEFYHVDLIGLEARLPDGAVLGRVSGVADFGAGDVIEIVADKPLVVPFTRAVVPLVDVAGGFLVVDPPAGLLDPAPGDNADGGGRPQGGEPAAPAQPLHAAEADESYASSPPGGDACVAQAEDDAAAPQPGGNGAAQPGGDAGAAQPEDDAAPPQPGEDAGAQPGGEAGVSQPEDDAAAPQLDKDAGATQPGEDAGVAQPDAERDGEVGKGGGGAP